jgi:hypothetical protein
MTFIRFKIRPQRQYVALLILALGVITAVYGLSSNPARTWPNLLLDGFYNLSLALSALFFIASQRLAGARWSAGMRRIPEALMLTLPSAALLMLLLYFGRSTLFPWCRPDYFAPEAAHAGRVTYLNARFVLARTVGALLIWGLFVWQFRRISLKQDGNRRLSLVYHHRLNRYSAAFVLVFALTFTACVYDWIISLDPHWFSTMFAVYIFAGTFVQGIAAVTLAAVLLGKSDPLREVVTAHKLHDLGKMLFAFSIFWMYIWTCQYLLIWYGNIPEEVTHYLERTNSSWIFWFALNPILNWAVPFLGLMSTRSKCRPRTLVTVCVVLLCGHWLDLYLQVMPALIREPKLGLLELSLAAGCIALAYLGFTRNLSKAPLVPSNDPVQAAELMAVLAAKNLHRSPAQLWEKLGRPGPVEARES